jgi:predicted TIM-barrel fold metal-dependent hydrolase
MAAAFDIVDSHAHVYPTVSRAAEFGEALGRDMPFAGDLDEARMVMRRRGVRKLVLLPLIPAAQQYRARMAQVDQGREDSAERIKGEIADAWTVYNEWAAGVARDQPDRFAAAVAVDPVLLGEKWARAEIERAAEAGARAIKIMPAWIGCSPADQRMRVVWELAERYRLPVVSQSGLTPYSQVAHPDNFDPIAVRFPRAKLVLAHMGLGAEERTVALTSKHANVFVDTSAWFNVMVDPNSWLNLERGAVPPTPDEVARLLRRIGIDRVLFGTNYALRDPAVPHEWMHSLPLTTRERRQIFSENYSRVFDD